MPTSASAPPEGTVVANQAQQTVQGNPGPPAGNAWFGVATLADTGVPASATLGAAPKDSAVIEDMFGQKVADPFRPLENLDAPATVEWWKSQNKRTQDFLSSAAAIKAETIKWHESIRNYTREGMSTEYGGNYFYTRQSGLEAQPTYYVRSGGPTAEPRVFINPNELSTDGTVSLGNMEPAPDGKIVAYTVSEAGSDMVKMRFRDVATGKDIHEELTGLRFTGATWDPDGKGVIYSKPLPEAEANGGKHLAVYYHKLGQPQSSDVQLYKRPDVADSFVGAYRLTEDDPFLFYYVNSGTNPESGMYVQRPGETQPTEILKPGVASLSPMYRDGDFLYATTDLNAPRTRIVKINMKDPAPEKWVTLVAESKDAGTMISQSFIADGKMIVIKSVAGADAMEVYDLNGTKLHDVALPTASKIQQTGQVRPKDKEFQLSIGGYLSPGTRYKYSVADNKLTFIKKSDIPRDLTDIATVERAFATSKDGTKIPMWIIKPKNVKMDGNTQTLLYGYGGFNNSLDPGFSYTIAHWVEKGGVYVVANLRGGGEFGREWYDGGRLKNKQNTFDDFAAVAKELIAQKYTNPKKLAIMGGSNGGLLTAATSQQFPELFGAVVSQVPVTDLMRFHTNNYGSAWKSDYGDPTKKEDFEVSIKYSPLHNVKAPSAVKYPMTLITTGDHDDRVAPWHAFKWAATRMDQGQVENTYLRVDERAGHGAGKPTKKVIEESADTYAFLVKALGL